MAATRLIPFVRVALLAAVATAAACTKQETGGNVDIVPAVASPPSASAAPAPVIARSELHLARPAAPSFAEAVRVGRWEQAAALLDSLPEAERRQPHIKYVRARVALALGDHVNAAVALEGLESVLPFLADDIALHRAEAQLHAGPQELAARYFTSLGDVRSLNKAAVAWESAGRLTEARTTIDRAIGLTRGKMTDDALAAYSTRARIAQAAGHKQQAVSDLRLVSRYSSASADDPHEQALERLDPGRGLTATERIERARRISRSGNAEAALAELDRTASSPGGPIPRARLLRERAMALYASRERYAEAAQVFEDAAKLGGPAAAECLFHAAKAWSRADENDRGLALYQQLIRRYPRTTWAERGSYNAARLQRLSARWNEAAAGYAQYLKQYPRGTFREEAAYERAVCLLAAGKAAEARPLLSRLAEAETSRADAAVLRHLAAVATHQAGEPASAVAQWQAIVHNDPLTWAALAATARLRSAGHPHPRAIAAGPVPTEAPLTVELPQDVRLLQELGLEGDAEERLMRMERDIQKAHGKRGAEALCRMYGTMGRAQRRFRIGQNHVAWRLVQQAPTPANRWAWDCLFPTPYAAEVQSLETRDALPARFLVSVMRQESAFNPEALSPSGARGLMQLMPATARRTAALMDLDFHPERVTTPHVNMSIGSHYLRMLLEMFDQHPAIAAAAYNAGPIAVHRWLTRGSELPLDLWVAQIPYRETRRYVVRVMGNLARYNYLERGDAGLLKLDLALPKTIRVPPDAY